MTETARPDLAPVSDLSAAQRRSPWRYFFVGLAIYYVAVAAVGFTPSYLEFVAGKFPIEPIVHLHGAIMATWLALLIAQTSLAASGGIALHRRLGVASTVLAPLVWIGMCVLVVNALHRDRPAADSFLYDVLLAQLSVILLFPLFFISGFRARRRPEVHRRLMIFAAAVLLQAAIDRMMWLPGLTLPSFWGHTFWLLTLTLSPLVAFDLVTLRRVSPVTLGGVAVIGAVHLVCALLWQNPAWHAFAFGLTAPLR